jgi:hypothetical protein
VDKEIHIIGGLSLDPSKVEVIRHHIHDDGPVHCPICNVLIGEDWEGLIYKDPCPHLEFEFVVDEASVFRPELEKVFDTIENLSSLLSQNISELGRYEPLLEKWQGERGYEKILLIFLGADPARVFLRVYDDHGDVLMGFSPELGV